MTSSFQRLLRLSIAAAAGAAMISSAAASDVALVESSAATMPGVGYMEYVNPGQVILLDARDRLVLVNLSLNPLLPASLVRTADAVEDTEKTISYLLDYVSKSDLTFIRNGQEATPKQAADHLRQKWDYFRNRIKTPEDFIRLTATKSELSGNLYLVRFKDGRESPAGEWLAKVLAEYRKRSSS